MPRYCPLSRIAASFKFFVPLVIPSLVMPWDSTCPMPKTFPIAMNRLIIYILRYFMEVESSAWGFSYSFTATFRPIDHRI